MTAPSRPAGATTPPAVGPDGGVPWWRRRLPELGLAVIVYVPLLFTQPGQVGADTKTYLYLDPARLLAEAPYLWDPGTGLGTVTHQNIGYLWPAGPFYWVMEQVGLPDWVAQRLWLGTILVAAGVGVLALLRELGWARDQPGDGRVGRAGWWNAGMAVAAFAYALSPYLLDYAARISVILLPWAALPWLIRSTERTLRRGGWRDPAVFALIVLTVGAVNATSLLLVGLGPLLWLGWRWLVERAADWRRVAGAALRIAALTLAVSAWWMAGLIIQGRYSVSIVRYTETYEAVAVASTTPEVLRGLGYWFFYGNDKLGQWIVPSIHYMRWGLPLSFALPIAALVSAAVVRFRRRGFFLALIVVGAVIAVGSHPYDDPSPAGTLFREFTRSDLGLAFRSTPRAVPLVILGTSVLLGAGVNALVRHRPRLTVPTTALALLLLALNLPSLFVGQMVDRNLRRDETIPEYWSEAVEQLDAGDHATRVLELPGTDFAAYRWGNTVDPITPGLMDRPYVARELIPLGSPVSANLVNAVDRPLQEGTFEPDALGPLARLLAAGDVVLRSDLEYERFRTPRPEATWELLRAVPGLDEPTGFGEPVENRPRPELPMVDEVELGTDPDLADPPPVAVFGVDDAVPIVRALPAARPIIVAGDGDGLVNATAAGLIDPDRAVLYSGDLLGDDALFDQAVADGAELVVTDTNRRRARRWGTIRENEGYTEQAGEEPLAYDVGDRRLDLFPEAGDDAKTVSVQDGGASVTATAYGNPVTYTPGDRATFAMDGDLRTAWKVGAFSEVTGERLRIDLDEPTRIDHLTLVQAFGSGVNRWITDIRLHFDDGDTLDAALDETSRRPPGQRIDLDPRVVSSVEIEITGDTVGFRPKLSGVSPVGFAEVGLADLVVDEAIRPPIAAVERLGDELADHPLSYVLQRLRNNPAEPVREDEEPALRRLLDLPDDRAFELTGQVRLSPNAGDVVIDRILGLPSARRGGLTTRASERLEGDLRFRARSALDGDPDTAWTTPLVDPEGQWIEVEYPEPVEVDALDLQIVTDSRHSVPTRLRVEADDGPAQVVDLPPLEPSDELGSVTGVPVGFEPVTGRRIRVTLDEVVPTTTTDWYSGFPVALPVALAELGLPGADGPSATGEEGLAACRDDLLTLDGEAVPVRLDGTLEEAEAREPLDLTTCDDEPVDLAAGRRRLESTPGVDSGLDVDGLVLSSPTEAPRPVPAPPPTVEVDDETRVSYDLTVDDADEPFWLMLGQSRNDGWEADVRGASASSPTTIGGYGNGWYVTPDGEGPVAIGLEWTPQRLVWAAAGVSVLAVLLCLYLIARPRRRPDDHGEQGARIRVQRPGPEPLLGTSTRTLVVSVGAATVASAVVAPIPVAVLVGVAVGLAQRWPWGPTLVRWTPPALYALIAVYVTARTALDRLPADFAWPAQFERVHWPGMLVVLFLAVEAGLTVARRRRAAGRTTATPEGQG